MGFRINRAVFLSVLLFGGLILLVMLGMGLYEARQENVALKDALELVEHSFEAERKEILEQVDSLQGKIEEQEDLSRSLKVKILELEGTRDRINLEADEKALDILRIGDVDSLRNEIARHYGR